MNSFNVAANVAVIGTITIAWKVREYLAMNRDTL